MLPGPLDLTFVPSPARPAEGQLLLYSAATPAVAPQSAAVAANGLGSWLLRLEPKSVVLRLPGAALTATTGLAMRLPDALGALVAFEGTRLASGRPIPASIRAWSVAAKLALELSGREELVPTIRHDERRVPRAVWAMALIAPEDRARRDALAAAMPPAAFPIPLDPTQRPPRTIRPEALLDAFLDAVADSIVRSTTPPRSRSSGLRAVATTWEARVTRALTERDNGLPSDSAAESALLASFASWSAPLLGAGTRGERLAIEMIAPPDEKEPFRLAFGLQSDDGKTVVTAAEIWAAAGEPGARPANGAGEAARRTGDQVVRLLRGLAEAARISPPVERSLDAAAPAGVEMTLEEAWLFLSRTAPVLAQSGVALLLPPGFEEASRRRLRARVRILAPEAAAARDGGHADSGPALGVEALSDYKWEVALGDDALSEEEFKTIAAMKAPLVRWRGQWVAVDPKDLERSRAALAAPGGSLAPGIALAALVSGETEIDAGGPIEVVADGDLAGLAGWLRSGDAGKEIPEPEGFVGSLRPYQKRGLGWLSTLESLGVGGCLADDMGLGKTIQMIALLLTRAKPTLLVCPTSVVGNWERELARFAPAIPVARHHGMHRARSAEELTRAVRANGVVVTTYALVRRDEALLKEIPWQRIVLDEAQAIKNSSARQSRAVRSLIRSGDGIAGAAGGGSAPRIQGEARIERCSRFALTGTPVENRLSELWSILDFCNPGLLGSLEGFRRRYALPIERWQDDAVAERLRRLVQPFVLRRLKSDPGVASSLPEKNEMTVVCSLTREQATLYQAQVDAAMREIKGSTGVRRRGRILALITALKQVCNHPSQFLKEPDGALAGRSGKLARLTEMMEEVFASGEKALLFTQFRTMGDRLVVALKQALGEDALFLHGGVPMHERDELVRRFQDDPEGPKVFVLSLKAGGLGLNLTAATHVFHFDRWWNPAVEDQATNRAHRIGQTKSVQVHKLVTAGTLEERIDKLLESKRGLAERVLGAGERWLTEMSDEELTRLVSLDADADVETEMDDPEETRAAP